MFQIDYKDGKLNRLDWDIMVHNVPYYGYHYHSNDYNDDEWFICKRDCPEDQITKNLVYASRNEMGIRWKIDIAEDLYTKNKWDETSLRKNTVISIYRNDKLFYEDYFRDLDYCLHRAYLLIKEFEECPINVGEIDFDKKIVGRKIWYQDKPAIIDHFVWGNASVWVVPDKNYIEKFPMPNTWKDEDWLRDSWPEYEKGLIVGINSPHIDWFRKDKEDDYSFNSNCSAEALSEKQK